MTENSQIQQLGAEVLRQPAAPVDDFNNPEFRELIENMRNVMQAASGVGIAAPQLGVSKRVVIVASRPTPRYPQAPEMAPVVMVNPRFDVVDAAMVKDWEGCLSVPGVRALVPRYRAVAVEFFDESGLPCSLALADFPARVFQHEFDHLEGMVYLDRVETNRDIISEAEFFKRVVGQEQAA
ncbi:peptide deformylase [Methylomonas sp. SURF-1]|uniref:Peptide deformylase n=1 Tax=Methylomonas aurea TaxID=2952224 RepID=A0ABT1UEB0_9GAMM|nr:peptide deformylase [Methylomonas sp. SURF-1]MCQ8180505.1 peptide deformylase [Methylomonas sp. SURF-1]